MKVFVTGATGFLGSYVSRLLILKGFEVWGMKRASSTMELVSDIKDRIRWTECTLFDTETMREVVQSVAVVIHCAGVISADKRNRKNMFRVNHEGTKELTDVCLDAGINKFIHISSIAALGKSAYEDHINEDALWEDNGWTTHYGRSKMLGELEVWRAHAEGLNVVILNPSVIFGGGFWHAIGSPGIVHKLAKGSLFYPTGGTGVVDVRDVARVAVDAIESDVNGERFILSAENISFKKMMDDIATQFDAKKPSTPLKGIYKTLSWRIDGLLSTVSGKRRSLTKQSIKNFSRNFMYNNSKSKMAFEITYKPWTVMIEDAAKAYKYSMANQLKSYPVKFSNDIA